MIDLMLGITVGVMCALAVIAAGALVFVMLQDIFKKK